MTTYTNVFGNQAIPSTDNSYASYTLTADTQFYWPQLAVSPFLITEIMDVGCAANYDLILPAANVVSVGQSAVINNTGASVFTVVDSAGSTVASVSVGQIKYIYLTDNTTAAGDWTVFTFGTGTSTADAATLAGLGLVALGSTLNQSSVVVTSTTSVTVPISYRAKTLEYAPGGGGLTCSLPTASTAGDGFFFNVTNQGTGSVTLDPSGSELIDGAATKVLVPGESCVVVCNAVKWLSIGYGRSTQFQFTKLVFDITGAPSFTLTSAQAANKLIQFIGTATAGVTVVFPAVVAVYYLQNDYAGAFSLTVKTASTTGITTLQNVRSIITCDGTDMVYSQTAAVPVVSIAGGTAGAVVYQSATDVTDFTGVGTSGQLLSSAGTGAPAWIDQSALAIPASSIPNTPAGNISSVTVQAAINELDTDKAKLVGGNTFSGTQNLIGNLLTGSVAVTPLSSDSSTAVATTAFVQVIAMNAALPAQSSLTKGLTVVSDGANAHWSISAGSLPLYAALTLGAF